MGFCFSAICTALLFASATGAPFALQAQMKAARADHRGAYASGRYVDQFAIDGHRDKDVRARIQRAFQQFFHGDPEQQAVYFDAGTNANGPLAYITDWANNDVRTEGLSYGMMIAVQLDHKAEFDAIWNWANTYMKVNDPTLPSYGFFAWSCKRDGTRNSDGPAPDGEEYFAMALYFASARWGDGEGIYDYHAQADALLRTMLDREPIAAGGVHGVAEFDRAAGMVRFTPNDWGSTFTDPSYHLPAFYELWARWGPVEDRAFWAHVAEVSRGFFERTMNPKTGLAPTYANFDGTPHATSFGQSAIFGYDAWRVASNLSVDWDWWHADAEEPMLADRVQAFFSAQPAKYGDIYTLEGKELDPTHAPGLIATNAAAGLAASDRRRARAFREALWDQPLPSGHARYYDGMLWMLNMLHISGEFRIWQPQWAQRPSSTATD